MLYYFLTGQSLSPAAAYVNGLREADLARCAGYFGHRAVVYTPNLQKLLAYLCKNGFEHHVAMTMGNVSKALDETFTNYMGWENYKHL